MENFKDFLKYEIKYCQIAIYSNLTNKHDKMNYESKIIKDVHLNNEIKVLFLKKIQKRYMYEKEKFWDTTNNKNYVKQQKQYKNSIKRIKGNKI